MIFTQILQTKADLEMVGGVLDSVDKFSQTFQVSFNNFIDLLLSIPFSIHCFLCISPIL